LRNPNLALKARNAPFAAFYDLNLIQELLLNPKHIARHIQSHKPSEIAYVLPDSSRDDGALFGYEYIFSRRQLVIAQLKKRRSPSANEISELWSFGLNPRGRFGFDFFQQISNCDHSR